MRAARPATTPFATHRPITIRFVALPMRVSEPPRIDEKLSGTSCCDGLTRMRVAQSRTMNTYIATMGVILTNADKSVAGTMGQNCAPTKTCRVNLASSAGSKAARLVGSAATTVTSIPTAKSPSAGIAAKIQGRSVRSANVLFGAAARVLAIGAFAAGIVAGQPAGFNYDETKVPEYQLPEILRMADGSAVETAAQWSARRAEILAIFERHVYGTAPEAPPNMRFSVVEESDSALAGRARRKQVRVDFSGVEDGPSMEILLYTPAAASGPVPVFVGLNFGGNHTIHADPAIRMATGWVRDGEGVVENRSTEETRGRSSSRWQVKRVLDRGYGLATVYCGDLDPDFDDGFRNGVHPLAPPSSPEDWGSIAAWAWGLSRALDYLATDADVDASRVAVMGHSRLGKTALWAGARDTRFAMVVSNDSGCGGAALSRRRFGETVERINTRFPHWFAENFKRYNGKEDDLPVDQHMLLALVAPRPLYVASAEDDAWADPKGEFLAAMHAGEAYELLGKQGLRVAEQPAVDEPVMQDVGYHIRSGKHDVTGYDWDRYLDFADKHLKLD